MGEGEGEALSRPDGLPEVRVPDDAADTTGDDLIELVASYVDACRRGDVLWAHRCAAHLTHVAIQHRHARLVEVDVLGFGWEAIGETFGLSAYEAASEFADPHHGPPFPRPDA